MIQKISIIYLVAVIFAIWGYVSGRYQVFPYHNVTPHVDRITEHFFAKDHILGHVQQAKNKFDFAGFKKVDNNFVDTGYLLISRFEEGFNQVVIELVRLSDFKIIHQWVPPIEKILKLSPNNNRGITTKDEYRAQHPLLLNNGDIVFHAGEGALVRINKENEIVWIIDEHFHHSIELMSDGNIIVPTYSYIKRENRLQIKTKIRDDGFVIVSPVGQIISRFYIDDILIDNGYRGLYLGVGTLNYDRTHINDVQPIYKNLGKARSGDLAISIRNLSTVLLYRPATNKVVWLKTGPWLNQHDINLLDDGRYSIFGNDVYTVEGISTDFIYKNIDNNSNIYIYDPETESVESPYTEMIEELEMFTETAGLSKILPNGDVCIEETDSQRIMRISTDKVRWMYVNASGEGTTGALHWSRYIEGVNIDKILN